jgi:hypothetical protein
MTESTFYALSAAPAAFSGLKPEADPASRTAPEPPSRIPRWLERLELFLRVLLRMYVGLALFYAPWSRSFWDQNPLFLHYPVLAAIATHGAIRGMVSGLGLLNLWIALKDAIRRRNR